LNYDFHFSSQKDKLTLLEFLFLFTFQPHEEEPFNHEIASFLFNSTKDGFFVKIYEYNLLNLRFLKLTIFKTFTFEFYSSKLIINSEKNYR